MYTLAVWNNPYVHEITDVFFFISFDLQSKQTSRQTSKQET